jgi:hypothetical protein
LVIWIRVMTFVVFYIRFEVRGIEGNVNHWFENAKIMYRGLAPVKM